MPYKDGSPTLGEQIEADYESRFYTSEILRECQQDRAEIKRLRAALLNIQALAERGFPIDHAKLAQQCRNALKSE